MLPLDAEWLETDGLGGYALGTVRMDRRRRYHGLLITATTPPTGRMVLVAGQELLLSTPDGHYALSTQSYRGGVLHPRGFDHLTHFDPVPWPTWTFALPKGDRFRLELLVRRGGGTFLQLTRLSGAGPAWLEVLPLLAAREDHHLHHENAAFDFSAQVEGPMVRVRPYAGGPGVTINSNGHFTPRPLWYRNFHLALEQARGLDDEEDLATPGAFGFELNAPARWSYHAGDGLLLAANGEAFARERARRTRLGQRRYAEDFLVTRAAGESIVAGYPWFTDWGRDTFIALRGLLHDQPERRRQILSTWAHAEHQGLLPNRFPDRGDTPEYHSVDAALWFVITCAEAWPAGLPPFIAATVERILSRYLEGTHFGIKVDHDGLLYAGQEGYALTWMDARIDGRAVTPRRGKPVELQCLWINALELFSNQSPRWRAHAEKARAQFRARFFRPELGYCYDVVDVDGVAGAVDAQLRPNQVLAIGGLPKMLLGRDEAEPLLQTLLEVLLVQGGLRTLAPDDPAYQGHYQGGPTARDQAYHQGTAWPWLLGPLVEAYWRLHGHEPGAKARAESWLAPLGRHRDGAGMGHLPEVLDGDPPHRPGGCPAQAWSLGEWMRVQVVLRGVPGGEDGGLRPGA